MLKCHCLTFPLEPSEQNSHFGLLICSLPVQLAADNNKGFLHWYWWIIIVPSWDIEDIFNSHRTVVLCCPCNCSFFLFVTLKNDFFFLWCKSQILHKHNISRDIMDIWRHLKQRHAKTTCRGIRVSVPISSKRADIEWYPHTCSSAFIAHF